MENEPAHFTQRDRDLMVSMNTKLERAISDIQSLSNNFVEKVEFREVINQGKDREERLRNAEDKIRLIWGALSIISFIVIPLITYIYFKHENDTQTQLEQIHLEIKNAKNGI